MGLSPIATRRLLPGFSDTALFEVDLFGLMQTGVRSALAADPVVSLPRDLGLLMNTKAFTNLTAGEKILAQLTPRAGNRGSWEMGDSRAENCLVIGQLRSLVNARKTELARTSLLTLDIDNVRGRAFFASPQGEPKTFKVDMFPDDPAEQERWEPNTTPDTFSSSTDGDHDFWEDYLAPMTRMFARKADMPSIGIGSLAESLGLTFPTRNVGVYKDTLLYADALAAPTDYQTTDVEWPVLTNFDSDIGGEGTVAESANSYRSYGRRFLETITALQLLVHCSKICQNPAFNPPDEAGEDKADGHRKRRRRQVVSFYSLGFAPFLATDALFELFLANPIVQPIFRKIIDRGGYAAEFEAHSAITKQYHLVAPVVAEALAAMKPLRSYSHAWSASVTHIGVPVGGFLNPLLETITKRASVTANEMTAIYNRVPGRFAIRPEALLAFIQPYLTNRKVLSQYFDSANATSADSLGGAWTTMAKEIGFIGANSGSASLAPTARIGNNAILVTNGVQSAQNCASIGEFLFSMRAPSQAAFGTPVIVAHSVGANELNDRVPESNTTSILSPPASQDFTQPGAVFIEVPRYADEEVGGAALLVNPRDFALLSAKSIDKTESGPFAMDFVLRALGDDTTTFPNTFEEWASRLGVTTFSIMTMISSTSELWGHLFTFGADKVPAPISGLVVESTLTRTISKAIAVEVSSHAPDAFLGFEEGSPATAALAEDFAFLRDAQRNNIVTEGRPVSGSILVELSVVTFTQQARLLLGTSTKPLNV